MTGYRLAIASPDDEAAVTALLEASYGQLMRHSYDAALLARALPLMTRANPRLLASGTYYLARSANGAVIGSGGWTQERPGTGKVAPALAHIRHFATHPGWIGRGVGRAIYAQCRQAAGAEGMVRFECYASLNAEVFYAALGFRRVRHLEIEIGPHLLLPSVVMEADL